MAPINNCTQMDLPTGAINQRCVDFYLSRAQGGIGLIITGAFKVENKIEVCMDLRGGIMKWVLISPSCMPMIDELAKHVQALGTKLIVQISAGPGRVTRRDVIESGVQPVSASASPCFFSPDTICRPLETEEVERIVQAFGHAAELLAQAGVDGVEIHGHEGYLLDQFSTALWNKRTDKYGGDLAGRLTLASEILEIIKNRVGKEFPVLYRFGVKQFVRGSGICGYAKEQSELGRDLDEAREMAGLLEQMGYDALDLDVGVYESAYRGHPPQYLPPAFSLDLIRQVKESVQIPVLAAGKLGNPDVALDAILKKKTDVILLGRSLMADPGWPLKVQAGLVEDIRPCIGCDEACRPKPNLKPISCSVNPACNRERSMALDLTRTRKKVWVVGGGIAGMEVARVVSLRGHHVTLIEKTDRLGGHLIEASVPCFKYAIKELLDWYLQQINRLPIEICLNQNASRDLLQQQSPDVVVIATGSSPSSLNIVGTEKQNVSYCTDTLRGIVPTGKRVAVVGGGSEGCETALWLARQGKNVTIIEQLPNLLDGVWWTHRALLRDLLSDECVQVLTGTTVREVSDDGVLLDDTQPRSMPFDTIVLAVGMKSNHELFDSLVGSSFERYIIGDAVLPRKIHHAIWEAMVVGRTI
jgi:2-enoate reductase